MTLNKLSKDGTVRVPNYFEEVSYNKDDVHMHIKDFTYKTHAGIVSGAVSTVMFTIDRPVSEVWPYFKDFNLWQNSHGYYYSGLVGDLYSSEVRDLGKETVGITIKQQNESREYPYHYEVLSVIPEHLIVLFQPIPENDDSTGGVSPGIHVFTLSEYEGKTVINVLMEHASRAQDTTEEEAAAYLRQFAPGVQQFWTDTFIPVLKKLVYEGK